MGLFQSREQATIVCLGLDYAGKSTILSTLQKKHDDVTPEAVRPTIGSDVKDFTFGDIRFHVHDLSGDGRYRGTLWERFYEDAKAIIFVVDSSDQVRMSVARSELEGVVNHPDVRDIPICVFANKMDVPGALEADMIAQELHLAEILKHDVSIFASNALTGQGLDDGITWIRERLRTSQL